MNESDFSLIKDDLIKEIEIKDKDVGEFKAEYYKKFLKEWIENEKMKFGFEEFWEQREKCNLNLEEQSN